jgi:transposase
MKKYIVELTDEERRELRSLAKTGKAAAYKIRHANILLKADQAEGGPGWTDQQIIEAFSCSEGTVANVRKRFVIEGFEAAVDRRREGVGRPRKLDGDAEARLTMIACSQPPKGHSRWTVRLLADRLVELEIVDSCSRMTVQRTMKKTS